MKTTEQYDEALADLSRELHRAFDPLLYRIIGGTAVFLGAVLYVLVRALDALKRWTA